MGEEKNPPGNAPEGGKKEEKGIDLTVLTGAVKELALMVKQQGETIAKLTAPKKEEQPKKKPAPNDLDMMSNSQLTEHLLTRIQEEVVKPLREDLTKTSSSLERKDVETQLKEVRGKYEHFDLYVPEIKAIIADKPGLDLEEALAIAEKRFPNKLVEFNEKQTTAKKQEEEKKQKEVQDSFGGLLPTSGRTAKTDKMDVDQAAEAAWNEVVSELPPGITLN